MSRLILMSVAIASMAACGISDTYDLPTGGAYVVGGGSGVSGGDATVGSGTASGGDNTGGVVGSTGGVANTGGITGSGPTGGTPGTAVGGRTSGGNVTASGTGGIGPGTTGTGTGRNSSTGGKGSTSGGSSCATELQPCGPNAPCCATTPKLACEKESAAAGSFCERSCKTESDCANAETVCSGGTCVLNICGGNSGNGSYDGACTADGSPGTCIPKGTNGNDYGLCILGGSSDGGCIINASTSEPADLCVGGQYCAMSINSPGDVCYVICDPGRGKGGGAVCKAAGFQFCFPIGDLGICANF
jgi:hypothetical protein